VGKNKKRHKDIGPLDHCTACRTCGQKQFLKRIRPKPTQEELTYLSQKMFEIERTEELFCSYCGTLDHYLNPIFIGDAGKD
jgi:hypothetical protein